MPATTAQPYAAFRLNFEQQQKRAKELLKAARAGDAIALQRLQRKADGDTSNDFRLAHAQHCIARELRFTNWAALKQHIAAMANTRAALDGTSRDADLRTMHIRCGDDIRQTLIDAGFTGTFTRHINPYLQGPVTDTPDWLEQRARFIVDSAQGFEPSLTYERVLQDLHNEEQQLAHAVDYERVVLWLEHDRYDQFVLIRCLAWFAEHGAPQTLELISPNDFPGAARFVGLGQLPPEALTLLWERRRRVSTEQLKFAATAWRAFRSKDPRVLAEFARNGTPLLPDLAAALHRHLQELPSLVNGLGLTQQLLLEALAQQSPLAAGRLVGAVMQHDPLPGLGDSGYDYELRQMEKLREALVERISAGTPGVWRNDVVSITEHGRTKVSLSTDGALTFDSERWVGGVHCVPGQRCWHWDDRTRSVMLR
jgi:hypothetical protein